MRFLVVVLVLLASRGAFACDAPASAGLVKLVRSAPIVAHVVVDKPSSLRIVRVLAGEVVGPIRFDALSDCSPTLRVGRGYVVLLARSTTGAYGFHGHFEGAIELTGDGLADLVLIDLLKEVRAADAAGLRALRPRLVATRQDALVRDTFEEALVRDPVAPSVEACVQLRRALSSTEAWFQPPEAARFEALVAKRCAK